MNVDFLRLFPDQNIEGRPTECVGESRADILGNIFRVPFDAGYSYAADLHLQRAAPTTIGEDPETGIQADVVYGALPIINQTFNALTTSELFEANFDNYSTIQKQMASRFAPKGYVQLRNIQEIAAYIDRTGWGVQVNLRWYTSFNSPLPGGVLGFPAGVSFGHSTACYGVDEKGLILKPWLGPTFGDNGYAHLSETISKFCFVSAFGYDPNAWRWLSLVQIALQHKEAIPDILPLLH